MANVIQLLPDSVTNQIAAGEVIQRPASVVKELMENAIDAGAKTIKVRVKNSGKTSIHVIDDGEGMSDTDARLSLERHATSKIKKAEDLFSIRTMGFRGEALASIAAIGQVEVKTRPADEEIGTLLVVEGSQVKKQEQEACQQGTSIQVKNIFFNIPARRNFLKSNPVELKHIIEEFQHIAIAHPDKSFILTHGDQVIHNLHPGKLSQRIVSLFGKSYQQQLAPCKEATTSMSITGYVGKPEMAKKTRGNQYIYVNGRYIRSNYINHAVSNAFEGLLPEGSYPFYVLFIEIDPKQIDINVHPTKNEIKFEDPRTVYGIVQAAVKKALGLYHLAPAIDFKTDINLMAKLNEEAREKQDFHFKGGTIPFTKKTKPGEWQSLFEHPDMPPSDDNTKQTIQLESAVNHKENFLAPTNRPVLQCHSKYIIREVQNGLIIIDQQAAHERILYEKYLSSLKKSEGESQQVLFQKTIEFEPDDFALLMEIEKEVKSLGFCFTVFGRSAILVTGVPPNTPGKEKEVLEELIEQFKTNKNELSLTLQEKLAWSLARRTSIQQGQSLDKEEINALVEGLFACETPTLTARGKSIFHILELSKIEHLLHH